MSDRNDYVERITKWVMPDRDDPELAKDARAKMSLDGVYLGSSSRIRRLVALAYLRGVRRGSALAWQAKQPISLRHLPPVAPENPMPAPHTPILSQDRLHVLSRDALEQLCVAVAEELLESVNEGDGGNNIESADEASQSGLQALAMAIDPSYDYLGILEEGEGS